MVGKNCPALNKGSLSAILLLMSMFVEAFPTQFIHDAQGNPIAAIVPIADYQRMKASLEAEKHPVDFVWDDEGELRPELKAQLLEQSASVRAGERGVSLSEAAKSLS